MATQDGVEQIAEIQSHPQQSYDMTKGYNIEAAESPNPLEFPVGIIVGDLLWQRQRGIDFDDDRYRGWSNREENRENYWSENNHQFIKNWQNQGYRRQYQNQNWQQLANHPGIENTYINNNRYDTTAWNNSINNTDMHETLINTNNVNNSRQVNANSRFPDRQPPEPIRERPSKSEDYTAQLELARQRSAVTLQQQHEAAQQRIMQQQLVHLGKRA